jgi:hypothetical protein
MGDGSKSSVLRRGDGHSTLGCDVEDQDVKSTVGVHRRYGIDGFLEITARGFVVWRLGGDGISSVCGQRA